MKSRMPELGTYGSVGRICGEYIIGVSTRQVRTSGDRDDPGGYRRLAAIEGRVYTRPVKRKSMTFYFVYHSTAILVILLSNAHSCGLIH